MAAIVRALPLCASSCFLFRNFREAQGGIFRKGELK